MIGLVLFNIAMMTGYLLLMAYRYGVRDYVSDNYYISRRPWMFSIVMVSSAFTLLPVMLDKGGLQFLAFLSAFGLALVGAEPHYKSRKAHAIGAYMALICGVGWCMSVAWLPTVVAIALYTVYLFSIGRKPYYVGEVLALSDMYITLMFY